MPRMVEVHEEDLGNRCSVRPVRDQHRGVPPPQKPVVMTTDEPDDEPDHDYTAATALAMEEEAALREATEPPAKPQVPLPDALTTVQKAAQLRDVVPASYIYAAAAGLFHGAVDVASCQVYLHQMFQEAGNPVDPVARMMIEQLAMAHHAIGRLHVRAATRESLAEVVAYHGVLARLMSEFRKTSLALQGLRKNAGSQVGSSQQQTSEGRPPTAGTVSAGESAVAAASACTELRSNAEGEGRERRANCA
jgi:hypothetical protein